MAKDDICFLFPPKPPSAVESRPLRWSPILPPQEAGADHQRFWPTYCTHLVLVVDEQAPAKLRNCQTFLFLHANLMSSKGLSNRWLISSAGHMQGSITSRSATTCFSALKGTHYCRERGILHTCPICRHHISSLGASPATARSLRLA